MIVDRSFYFEGGRQRSSVSMRVDFDKADEAHAFNVDLVELYLKHLRLVTPPYEYETNWC